LMQVALCRTTLRKNQEEQQRKDCKQQLKKRPFIMNRKYHKYNLNKKCGMFCRTSG
jgi:hypothetical protein